MKQFETLKDHVYNYIEAQIQSGSLRPNQRINEAVICKELNISRTPVREALIQLSAEGVLENTARKGFVLKAVNERDVEELYAVIGLLDGQAARLACPHLTAGDLKDLEFYVEAMDLAIKSGNFLMYDRHQIIFHQLYIDKCGNRTLIDTIGKTKSKLLQRAYIDDPEGKLKAVLFDTNREHREILRRFREGDGQGLFEYLSEVHWCPVHAHYELTL